jgi:hypothetical protein
MLDVARAVGVTLCVYQCLFIAEATSVGARRGVSRLGSVAGSPGLIASDPRRVRRVRLPLGCYHQRCGRLQAEEVQDTQRGCLRTIGKLLVGDLDCGSVGLREEGRPPPFAIVDRHQKTIDDVPVISRVVSPGSLIARVPCARLPGLRPRHGVRQVIPTRQVDVVKPRERRAKYAVRCLGTTVAAVARAMTSSRYAHITLAPNTPLSVLPSTTALAT